METTIRGHLGDNGKENGNYGDYSYNCLGFTKFRGIGFRTSRTVGA